MNRSNNRSLAHLPQLTPPRRRALFPASTSRLQQWGDPLFRRLCQSAALFVIAIAVLLLIVLVWQAWLAIQTLGTRFFTTTTWDPEPTHRAFGALAFVYGTVATSVIAMVIAVPLGVGTAVFLSEIAPHWLRKAGSFFVELLAAVPSVVYGFWGLFVLAPLLQSIITALGGPNQGGVGILSAGVILSIMVVPYISAVSYDVCQTVPRSQREGSYALGATKWQTIWSAVLPAARPGIVGGCFLALGRALGETMAVTMLIGNKTAINVSLFAMGNSIPSVIANEFTEATYDLYLSALVELGLLLFVVTAIINGLARLLIWKVSRSGRVRSGYFSRLFQRLHFWERLTAQSPSRHISVAEISEARSRNLIPTANQKAHRINRLMTGGTPKEAATGVYLLLFYAALGAAIFFLVPDPSLREWLLAVLAFVAVVTVVASAGALGLCLAVTAGFLLLILGYLVFQGVSALSWDFFTKLPAPVGEAGGGMANAICGSFLLVGLGTLFAVPLGMLAAIYLAEYRSDRLGPTVRFVGELLGGVPSIVIGIFAYYLVVKPMGHFSAWAGAFALGVMMVPIIMRVSEDALRAVPRSIRDASIALGARHYQTILKVTLPASLSALVTAVFLSIGRVVGETAPLLLTAFSNSRWPSSPNDATPSLPYYIFTYAISPYDDWHRQGWAAALVLLMIVMILSFGVRLATGRGAIYASRVE